MKRLNKIELFLNYGSELKHIEIDLNTTYKQIEELRVYNKNLENIIDDENEEIERLNNIIKEAKHLINHNDIYDYRVFEEKLLKILDGDSNVN